MQRMQAPRLIDIRSRIGKFTKHLLAIAIALAFCVFTAPASFADPFDAAALRELALSGVWTTEETDMGYWTWNEDGTVCLGLFEPSGECDDRGTWTIDGDAMCYALEWWGEMYGYRENCFTVQPIGDGRYQALYREESQVPVFVTFSVLE